MVSITRKFCEYRRWPTIRISVSEITDTSDVSLTIEMYSLASDGNATRKAWGMTTRHWVPKNFKPSARAASPCPLGIDSKPPRWISATYAVSQITSANRPDQNGSASTADVPGSAWGKL